jgi:hypothetical protein
MVIPIVANGGCFANGAADGRGGCRTRRRNHRDKYDGRHGDAYESTFIVHSFRLLDVLRLKKKESKTCNGGVMA